MLIPTIYFPVVFQHRRGFILAMGSLVVDQPPSTMFFTLVLSSRSRRDDLVKRYTDVADQNGFAQIKPG